MLTTRHPIFEDSFFEISKDIVSLSKIDRSKLKLQLRLNLLEIMLSNNRNSWANGDVMIKYLIYFYERFAKMNECFLNINCLFAHKKPSSIFHSNQMNFLNKHVSKNHQKCTVVKNKPCKKLYRSLHFTGY